jgi:thymidylate kinase
VTTVAIDAPTADRPILGTASAVDAVADQAVLVIGSAPPHCRDLDLVAMPADYVAISRRLEELGHLRRRSSWVRFDPDGISAVDLFSTAELRLAGDVGRLFEDAVPVPDYRRLVRPAPHAILLLTARALVVRRGRLTDKARRRVEQALQDDAGAWSRAEEVATHLGLTGPLNFLRRTVANKATPSALARASGIAAVALANDPVATKTAAFAAAVPRRLLPMLVSLSGPHGIGKSTQVENLRSTLSNLGLVAETQHAPVRPRRVPPIVRRITPKGRDASRSEAAPQSGPLGPLSTTPTAPRSPLVRMLAHAWCIEGVVVSALRMWGHALRSRHAHVLIFDRFAVDTSVTFAYWFEHRRGVNLKVEQALLRLLFPRTCVTVLFLADAETLHSRRADEYTLEGFDFLRGLYAEAGRRFGAILVDAHRPVAEVARDVATVVWPRLP